MNHKSLVLSFFTILVFSSYSQNRNVDENVYIPLLQIDTCKSVYNMAVYDTLTEIAKNGKSGIYDLRIYSDTAGNTYLMISETDIQIVMSDNVKYRGINESASPSGSVYFFVRFPHVQTLPKEYVQVFSETTDSVNMNSVEYAALSKERAKNSESIYKSVDGDDFYLGMWIDGKLQTIRKHLGGMSYKNKKYSTGWWK